MNKTIREILIEAGYHYSQYSDTYQKKGVPDIDREAITILEDNPSLFIETLFSLLEYLRKKCEEKKYLVELIQGADPRWVIKADDLNEILDKTRLKIQKNNY